MRIVQGGILAALVIISGLLYSIRNQMMTQPAAMQAAQAMPAMPGAPAQPTQPMMVPAPAPAPLPPAYALAPAPAPAPRAVAPAPAAATAPRRTTSIPRAPAAAPAAPAPDPAPVYAPPSQPAPMPSAAPAASVGTVTVPAGTAISIRLLDTISTDRNRPGDTFQATLEEAMVADGVVVAERGANVMGRVVHAQQSGRVAGLAELALELDRIHTIAGDVQIASDTMIRRADTSKGRDAITVGTMAGVGAAIGAVAGGRKGAGIGAAAGTAAGTGTVLSTRGKPVQFDPETRLTFRLRAPMTMTVDYSRARQPGYDDRPRYEDRPRLQRRD